MHCTLALSAALLGLFARVTAATACTAQNATPIESLIGSSGGGGSGGGGGAGADIFLSVDPFAVLSNAVKKRATTPDAKLANIAVAVGLVPRSADSAQCSATESCFSIQGTPFCLDTTTGAFHDGVGTTGNALTGNYTLADGRSGNLYTGPYPQPTGTAAYAAGQATTTAAGGTGGGAGQATAGTNAGAGAGVTATAAAGASSNGGGAANTASAAATGGSAGESAAAATQSSAAGQTAATASATHNAAAPVNKGTSGGAALGGIMGLLGALLL